MTTRKKAKPKPKKPTSEAMKMRHVRMPDDLWEKCLALGGSAWVRAAVEAAAPPKGGTT